MSNLECLDGHACMTFSNIKTRCVSALCFKHDRSIANNLRPTDTTNVVAFRDVQPPSAQEKHI